MLLLWVFLELPALLQRHSNSQDKASHTPASLMRVSFVCLWFFNDASNFLLFYPSKDWHHHGGGFMLFLFSNKVYSVDVKLLFDSLKFINQFACCDEERMAETSIRILRGISSTSPVHFSLISNEDEHLSFQRLQMLLHDWNMAENTPGVRQSLQLPSLGG